MPWPAPKHQERLLLKNAPWKEINARIASTLAATPSEGTVQLKTDRLMSAVWDAVYALTPKAKPSSHAKRWWTDGTPFDVDGGFRKMHSVLYGPVSSH